MILFMNVKFLTYLKKAWLGIKVNDENDKRTRFIMTIWAFMMISGMIVACFIASLCMRETDITLAYIDLIKHMMYVMGGVVSIFFGVESFFPSEARNYSGLGGWGRDTRNDPPVGPKEDDSQVD